ncbi:uncharacterized protein N7511_006439 [Penicillium nucicola]|uniref:uncharacterized protein n=1 Tax=Penicillium nucicola TaxID=1850975 RepID=UPI002545277C|nr:uncharacterized protein N7511_006439 [Penicillium nucicola]KAJ5757745.1 hypothetical protein N7511_006439 [Penicillium nucicola]
MSAVSLSLSHQITAIRLLAESLNEATRTTTALPNQAHNELTLLLTVLNATETYSSLFEADCPHSPVLAKRLQSCHGVLVDLQKLQLRPDVFGAQSQINEIRGSLSSLIFAMSDINTNMMMFVTPTTSQKSINEALKSIDLDSSAASDILNDDIAKAEADQAWAQLQHWLDIAGVSPKLSTQNREYIISALREMIKSERRTSIDTAAASEDISTPSHETLPSSHRTSLSDTIDSPKTELNGPRNIPLLPRDTKPPRRKPVYSHGSPITPVVEENLPIPVLFQIQDSAGIRGQPPPREDLPIPTWTESATKSMVSSTEHTSQTNTSTPSISTIPETNPTTLDPTLPTLKVIQNKKTNRMSRLIFQMTNSKEKLITPIQKGDLQTVTALLTKGANTNATNSSGHTPLMAAASYGHEQIVRVLLEFGANPETQSTTGETALGAAAARGFEQITRILIASGANPNTGQGNGKTALSQAAAFGQDRIVALLLDCGAEINALNVLGRTALALAAANGNIRVARVLLDRGADVGGMGGTWQSPLLEAVRRDYVEIVVLLMARGANPGVVGVFQSHETALACAVRLNRVRILGVFRRYGYEGCPVQYF